MSAAQIIIDTDPGVDDTLALAYVASTMNERVLALTTVYGNASVEDTTRNAGYIVNTLGAPWQLYQGAAEPLQGKAWRAKSHGTSGLGELQPEDMVGAVKPMPELAVGYLRRSLQSPVDLFCLGPMTNLANLLRESPELADNIGRLIIMGGAFSERGNVTEDAEFNVYNDPLAFQIVMDVAAARKMDTVVIPVEVCRKVLLTRKDLSKLERMQSLPRLREIVEPFLYSYTVHGGFAGAVLYDVLVPLCWQFPQLFTLTPGRVDVVCRAGATYGKTKLVEDPASTVKVCTDIQADVAKEYFMRALCQSIR